MALGRYNIDRYNVLPGSALRYDAAYDMYSPITAAFATSSVISPSYFCSQSLAANMTIGYGYDVSYDLIEALTANAELEFFISPPYTLGVTMTADMDANLNIRPLYNVDQALSANTTANYAVYVKGEASAEMLASMLYDIAHYPKYDVYQGLGAQFGMQPMTLVVMRFDELVIPPGGILVIDADNCTAYLDNQNVIDLYSGDFLWLNKQLLSLDVTSNTSGAIDVKLLYQERFL